MVSFRGQNSLGNPPPPPVSHLRNQLNPVAEILQNIIRKDLVPKEDLRRTWNNKKSEREKLLKQWNKAKESLAYLVS